MWKTLLSAALVLVSQAAFADESEIVNLGMNNYRIRVPRCSCAPSLETTEKKYLHLTEDRELTGKVPPKQKRRVLCNYFCRNRNGELETLSDTLVAYDSGNKLSCYGTIYGAEGIEINNPHFLKGAEAFKAKNWGENQSFLPRISRWAQENGCKGFFESLFGGTKGEKEGTKEAEKPAKAPASVKPTTN